MPEDNPLAPAVSPLAEADATSINELIATRIDDIMNKRPLLVTDEELLAVIEYHRKNRERFMLESAAKALLPPGQRRRKVPGSVAEAIASSSDLL